MKRRISAFLAIVLLTAALHPAYAEEGTGAEETPAALQTQEQTAQEPAVTPAPEPEAPAEVPAQESQAAEEPPSAVEEGAAEEPAGEPVPEAPVASEAPEEPAAEAEEIPDPEAAVDEAELQEAEPPAEEVPEEAEVRAAESTDGEEAVPETAAEEESAAPEEAQEESLPEGAPECTREGCAHIGQDPNGLDIPLCALGQWLMERQEGEGVQGGGLIDLSLGDACLFRSGEYRAFQSGRTAGNLEIPAGRRVSLTLDQARMGTLVLGAGSEVRVSTIGVCEIAAVMLSPDVRLVLAGDGACSVRGLARAGAESAEVAVTGGSWHVLGIAESRGRQMQVFSARGTTRATVDGETYDYTCPDSDGRAYLYLPAPGENETWEAEASDGVLRVFRKKPEGRKDALEIVMTVSGEGLEAEEEEAAGEPEEEMQETGEEEAEVPAAPEEDEAEGGEETLPEAAEETEEAVEDVTELVFALAGGEEDVPPGNDGTPSQPEEGQEEEQPAEETVCEAGGTYTVTGTPQAALRIEQEGVTLVLDDANVDASLLRASCPYTLRVAGDSVITGSLAWARVISEAELTLLGQADATVTFVSGEVLTDTVPEGYMALPGSYDRSLVRRAVLQGKELPLLTLMSTGDLLLERCPEGMRYVAVQEEDGLSLALVPSSLVFPQSALADGLVLTDVAALAVEGPGTVQEGFLALKDVSANAYFSGVQLHRDDGILRLENARVTAVFTGDSQFGAGTACVVMDENSEAVLRAPSGRLLLQQQNLPERMQLYGNIKLVPEPEAEHLTLRILDRTGQVVANEDVTLLCGGKTYDFMTHFDGTLSLWGMALDMDGLTVIGSREGLRAERVEPLPPQAPLTISDIRVRDLEDGAMEVTFSCPEALSSGVTFIAAQQARDLPEGYVERAETVMAKDGRVRLEGIGAGMTVSLRVIASRTEGAVLSAEGAGQFVFSPIERHVHRAPYVIPGGLDAVYTGKPYALPFRVPQDAKVSYLGSRLSEDGLPREVGGYTMKVEIPEGNAAYLPGSATAGFSIRRIRLAIVPDPNQEKYMGEEDPALTFTAAGLLEGDEVGGVLLREEGEEPGNYAFDLSALETADWYTPFLPDDAPVFTILPGDAFFEMDWSLFGSYSAWEALHPVRQEIVRPDGRALSVVWQATDSLQIGDGLYWGMVYDALSNQESLFTPSLSWDEGHGTLLLRLRTEPQLMRDRGYATDEDGNLIWGGRYVRLSWQLLEYLERAGVDAVSLVHAEASLTVSVQELMSSQMQALAREKGWDLSKVRYQVLVMPSRSVSEDILRRRPVTDGWTMGIYMSNGQEHVDVTDRVKGALAAVDLEPVARLMDSVGRYDAVTFGSGLELIGAADPESTLESTYVRPSTEGESDKVRYGNLMYNHRYLVTDLSLNDTLYCINAQKAP